MKKIAFIFVLTSMFASAANAHGNASNTHTGKRVISVTGEAEVRVVPDQVLISIMVETRGKALVTTKEQNDFIVQNILAYVIEDINVDKKHVQTDYVNVNTEYVNCRYAERIAGRCDPFKVAYYNAKKGIEIRLSDLERYEDIVTKALALGANNITNVQFITTDLRKHKDKARELAAIAAKEKAQAVAAILDMKVLKPISIDLNTSSGYFGWNGRRNSSNAMTQNSIQSAPSNSGGTDSGNLSLGQIKISAKVDVTFEME